MWSLFLLEATRLSLIVRKNTSKKKAYVNIISDASLVPPLSFYSFVDSSTTVSRFSEDLRLIDIDLLIAYFGMVTDTILCLPLARGSNPNSATTITFLFAQIIIIVIISKCLATAFLVLLDILYLI